MKLGEHFLKDRGRCLRDFDFMPDSGQVELGDDTIVFYHYSQLKKKHDIFSPSSGLYAGRSVECPNDFHEYDDTYIVEGFLEPIPKWLTDSPYLGDIGINIVKRHLGHLLLKVEVPRDFPGVYVVDYAHMLDWQIGRRRPEPLGLGYAEEEECKKAYVHSYIPMLEYQKGHVAPIVHVLRKGKGIVIPNKYLEIANEQPLREVDGGEDG